MFLELDSFESIEIQIVNKKQIYLYPYHFLQLVTISPYFKITDCEKSRYLI